jgi:hypothetical protein
MSNFTAPPPPPEAANIGSMTHLCILRRNLRSLYAKADLTRRGGCHLEDNLTDTRAQVDKDVIFRYLDLVNHLTDQVIWCFSIHLWIRTRCHEERGLAGRWNAHFTRRDWTWGTQQPHNGLHFNIGRRSWRWGLLKSHYPWDSGYWTVVFIFLQLL